MWAPQNSLDEDMLFLRVRETVLRLVARALEPIVHVQTCIQ